MKNIILFLLCFGFMSGCTSMKKTESVIINNNPRVIERDLTKDHGLTMNVGRGDVYGVEFASANPGQNKKAFHYEVIGFSNESVVLKEHGKLDALVAKLKRSEHIYLIGHSHGWSKYGTNRLATERTNAVAYHLTKKGVEPERIHKLASWSDAGSSSSPNRGVQVFILNKEHNNNFQSLITQL